MTHSLLEIPSFLNYNYQWLLKMASKKNRHEKTDKNVDQGKAAENQTSASVAPAETKKKTGNGLNVFLWIMIAVAIAAAVLGNYYFSQPATLQPLYIRIALVLGCIAVAMVCGLLTTSGKKFLKFSKDARGELRRVTWPTREETTKSAIGVAVVVFIIAIFLWFSDVVIGFIVNLITNV
jgi:preprotein translocase subunit SecE